MTIPSIYFICDMLLINVFILEFYCNFLFYVIDSHLSSAKMLSKVIKIDSAHSETYKLTPKSLKSIE